MAVYDMFGTEVDEPYGHTGPPDIPNGVPAPSNPPGGFNPADDIHPVPGTNPNTGGTGGNATPSPAANPFDASRVPAGIDPAWAADFIARNPGDYSRITSAYQSPRTGESGGTPTSPPVPVPRSTVEPPSILRPTSGTGAPAFSSAGGFSDPASSLLETYALDQFGRRINPAPNSGTALYEQYARELIDTLKQPVYSPQDESILKTRATDAIEQQRSATKQRWIEELSARNIPLSSGIALDGLQRIEQSFNGLRTQAEAQFATDAIATTRQNRLQVLDTAGNLATEQEARLQDAGNYARVPYDLQNQAFQRNLDAVNAGGSPAQLTANALARAQLALQTATAGSNRDISLAQLAAQQQLLQSGNSSAMTAALLQYLGYLFN